jgi:2,4-dienoyl-CoA reductase (NADPH2)
VEQTVEDYVRCARLAQSAGYDGVEIMGSEGYLINEFIATETNKRTDEWGGDYANRMRFPTEIVRRIRAAVGPEFIVIYRLSMLDLVPGGSTLDEVVRLAKEIEAAGADILNTGVGWHEARIPTIATMVPRGRVRLGHQEVDGFGLDPAGHQQPDQHSRCRRIPSRAGVCRSGLDGAALPRRS